MAFKKLGIETWGIGRQPTVFVRIKRQLDRYFLDVTDGTFKPEAKCRNPWVKLGPSSSPYSPCNVEIYLDLDPAQWVDGAYTAYFHDENLGVVGIGEVTILDGDSAPHRFPTTTEIAGRVLDSTVVSHSGVGTVGAWMQDVTNRLKAIETKIGK